MADYFNMDAFMKAANAINPLSPPGEASSNDFNMDAFSRAIGNPLFDADRPSMPSLWDLDSPNSSGAPSAVGQPATKPALSDLDARSSRRVGNNPLFDADQPSSADPWAQLGAPALPEPNYAAMP
jgi:hypothetical protein